MSGEQLQHYESPNKKIRAPRKAYVRLFTALLIWEGMYKEDCIHAAESGVALLCRGRRISNLGRAVKV
jgi:hypothetical protein